MYMCRVDSDEKSEEERWEKETTSLVYPYKSAAGPTALIATLQNETSLDLLY